MIPITDLSWQGLSWQEQLSNSIRSSAALAASLNLAVEEIETDFAVNVPLPYISRIEPENPSDPLLLQVLTQQPELNPGGLKSPLSEQDFNQGHGVIQKYLGRVLVVTTGACAINCRYCFRRHFPYEEHQPSSDDWAKIIEQIGKDSSISEVILSGGDPLMFNDRRLRWIFSELNAIAHVQTIRIHTRMPVVIPARVTRELLEIFNQSRCPIVIVTHINHGNEIDASVVEAMSELRQSRVTLLNQSVLLRGINDNLSALSSLSRRLIDAGIVPYYLHLMDPVEGAQHFDVPEQEGTSLIEAMRNTLPGYQVPRLAREVPFESAKTLIG